MLRDLLLWQGTPGWDVVLGGSKIPCPRSAPVLGRDRWKNSKDWLWVMGFLVTGGIGGFGLRGRVGLQAEGIFPQRNAL